MRETVLKSGIVVAWLYPLSKHRPGCHIRFDHLLWRRLIHFHSWHMKDGIQTGFKVSAFPLELTAGLRRPLIWFSSGRLIPGKQGRFFSRLRIKGWERFKFRTFNRMTNELWYHRRSRLVCHPDRQQPGGLNSALLIPVTFSLRYGFKAMISFSRFYIFLWR